MIPLFSGLRAAYDIRWLQGAFRSGTAKQRKPNKKPGKAMATRGLVAGFVCTTFGRLMWASSSIATQQLNLNLLL